MGLAPDPHSEPTAEHPIPHKAERKPVADLTQLVYQVIRRPLTHLPSQPSDVPKQPDLKISDLQIDDSPAALQPSIDQVSAEAVSHKSGEICPFLCSFSINFGLIPSDGINSQPFSVIVLVILGSTAHIDNLLGWFGSSGYLSLDS